MAKAELFFEELWLSEGGYSNHKSDKGGATSAGGVTLKLLKTLKIDKDKNGIINEADLKKLTKQDVYKIFKSTFWDSVKADGIYTQAIANILVDWVYNSGGSVIKKFQRILKIEFMMNCDDDGIVGPQTIYYINMVDQKAFFDSIKRARLRYYEGIVKEDPTQVAFIKGWKNRLNKFEYNV